MKIHELIYVIEEMYNNITDYPEEYSYEQHMLPLKLQLVDAVIGMYYDFDMMSVYDVENTLWTEFGLQGDSQ